MPTHEKEGHMKDKSGPVARVRRWRAKNVQPQQRLGSTRLHRNGKAFYYPADRLKCDDYIATVGMWPERRDDAKSS